MNWIKPEPSLGKAQNSRRTKRIAGQVLPERGAAMTAGAKRRPSGWREAGDIGCACVSVPDLSVWNLQDCFFSKIRGAPPLHLC